jgi:hypothetical protein
MQLAAVLIARTLAFVESLDLNPRGQAFYPDIAKGLVEKFGFHKFPQKPEEFDETKGVEFIGGKWGNVIVERFTIFGNGLLLDTRVSTSESQRVLLEGIAWAASSFGLKYEPKMITRWGYLSNLTFYSELPLLKSNSSTSNLVQRVQDAASKFTGDRSVWEPTIFTIHAESTPKKPLYAPFTIQRRAECAFSENKYFSEAPLPTDVHLDLLEQFEADVRAAGN